MHKTIFLILLIVVTSSTGLAMSMFLFSDKDYQKNISIKAFLINNDQICEFIKTTNDFNSLKFRKIQTNKQYLAIAILNNGNKRVWGTINCEINERSVGEINIPGLGPNMFQAATFIIPIQGVVFQKTSEYPKVSIKWINLNAK